MMASMPKKKPPGLKHIHFRLKPSEAKAIEADRKSLPGVPVTASAYAKHAVLSHAKLRKLEDQLRLASKDGSDQKLCVAAQTLLSGVGL